MDVKIALFNGHLTKEAYMVQPEGFVNPKYPNRVCKLQRSIYGLEQVSRKWNKRFDEEIKKFFTQNRDELCVYVKASGSKVNFLILYVDDILIMGHHIPMLQDVKSYLGKCFAMKYLGEAAYVIRIKIYRDRSMSIPMQEKPILSKAQGASTPAEVKHMRGVSYAPVMGSIMNTKDMFLVYSGDTKLELRVTCYTNSGYQTNVDDSKSQIGYIIVLNGGFIFRLRVVPTTEDLIPMYCDNTGAIIITNEHGITRGAKHYRTKLHYLREVIELRDMILVRVHTDDNIVDPLTKALPFNNHSIHTKSIGLLVTFVDFPVLLYSK
ncbi:retrotransposon protein, putative, ty1-copia subclass [Tanacetum coccineum]